VSESSLPAGLADLPRPELAAGWWPWAEDNTRLREVNARLREVVEAQAVQLEVLKGQQQALARRVEELERKTGKDSSNSGKPPSSDPVWGKKSAGKKGTRRSLRERGARSPGKQPGAGSSTLKLVDDPDEPAPAPVVTEYRAQAKCCPGRRRHEVCPSGVHPLPDPPAHRGPQRGGDRRGRRAARLHRHHRPRRIQRL
jgi:hypothetical protein